MDNELLLACVIFLLLSIFVNIICSHLKISATVGFLLTGILCGPSALGIIDDPHSIELISEIGVALLLFTIGMELSGDALARLKKPVFLGGSLQILLTIAGTLLIISLVYGRSIQLGIFYGCVFALSSSAIVLRLLQEKGQSDTPSGHLSLAILVFQDIMVAPMILIIPLLSGTTAFTPESIFSAIIRTVVILGGVLLFAKFGLAKLMTLVVKTKQRELLLVTTLSLCMGLALLTEHLGLSLSLGAFLAGLLLARSEYSMSVVAGVLPYRDVFMSIFFISVGMLLNLDFLANHIWPIIIFTLLIIFFKAILIIPAVLIQGYPLKTAIIVAITLAQVGEFAFVLGANGLSHNLISADMYQSLLASSIITMMLAPTFMFFAPTIADKILRLLPKRFSKEYKDSETKKHKENHLIIIGFGVSGRQLAKVSKKSQIPYEILEMNPDTITRYKDKEPISHGDASHPLILKHLGITSARVLAIVISDPAAVRSITAVARSLNPAIYIIARTRFLSEVEPLHSIGANAVIAEELESSMEVFSRVLYQYLIPQQKIEAFISKVRRESYDMIRSTDSSGQHINTMFKQMPEITLQTIVLEDNSPLIGKNLQEAALRQKYNLTIVAIQRDGVTEPTLDAEHIFAANDTLYLFGIAKNIRSVSPLLINNSDLLEDN